MSGKRFEVTGMTLAQFEAALAERLTEALREERARVAALEARIGELEHLLRAEYFGHIEARIADGLRPVWLVRLEEENATLRKALAAVEERWKAQYDRSEQFRAERDEAIERAERAEAAGRALVDTAGELQRLKEEAEERGLPTKAG